VHPSLLPAFAGGMHAVEDALDFGAKVSGCTVQLLEPGEPDGGPVVLQAAVPVREDDDAESLRMRIHEQEWRILPEAVALFCGGRLRREGRRVRILPFAEVSTT
jgi:phosphoribosylglycinamide formyltransferase-1